MPHDLFGDVAARPQSVRSHRSPLVFLSIGAHAVLLVGVVVTSINASDALPFPKTMTVWNAPVQATIVDIPLPKPPRQPTETAPGMPGTPPRTSVAQPVAAPPTQAPPGIALETGREGGRGALAGGLDEPTERRPIDGSGLPGAVTVQPAPPAAPVRLHSGIRTPRRLNDVAPHYPMIAQRARVEGIVILEATIDASGSVQSARVLRSIPLLDEAAVDAVRQWRFEPAQLNGQPVAVIMTVTVKFTLNR